MCFVMKIVWFILFMYGIIKLEKCMDSLIITDKNKSYYANVKNVNRFICNNTQNNNKKYFRKYGLQYFS